MARTGSHHSSSAQRARRPATCSWRARRLAVCKHQALVIAVGHLARLSRRRPGSNSASCWAGERAEAHLASSAGARSGSAAPAHAASWADVVCEQLRPAARAKVVCEPGMPAGPALHALAQARRRGQVKAWAKAKHAAGHGPKPAHPDKLRSVRCLVVRTADGLTGPRTSRHLFRRALRRR